MKQKIQISLASAVVLAILWVMIQLNHSYAAPTFTGDAAADFTGPNVIRIDDRSTPDVGLPHPAFPTTTISGFDIRALYLEYEEATDTMYVGIDCFGICGDTDGDGDPGGTSTTLADLGGEDVPEFGPGESFGLLIDTDNDYSASGGDFDVVIGVRDDDDLSQIGAFAYTGLIGEEMVNEVWGDRLANPVVLFQSPSATAPDLEFSIANFSTLPGFTPGQLPQSYQLHSGMGALGVDDGIGEDYLPDQTAVVITPTPTPTPTASPTPPPPTEVPPTGAHFASHQEWTDAQQVDTLAMAAQQAAVEKALFQLEIPTIDLTTAVLGRGWQQVAAADGTLVSQWEEVAFAAGWHKNSAALGQPGNTVISGHNNVAGSVFRDLWQLTPGETIYLDQGRVRYAYVIDQVTVERETNASPAQQAENAAYLHQTDDNRLTLITCWPWNDTTHRVFVVAKLTTIQMTTGRR
ncbi:MAG: sortase [Caldilineaceae bacterium]